MNTKPSAPRLRFVFIVLLFSLPIVAAWLLYASGYHSARTSNHGDLVMPARPLPAFKLRGWGGGEVSLDTLKGHWNFVVFADAGCDARCAANLYKMRQTRLALGKDMGRVQRLLVMKDPRTLPARLLAEHAGLVVAAGDGEFLARFRLAEALDAWTGGRLYVVDPLGNLMMSYPPDAEPRGILKDLERLLKYSKWAG